MINDKLGLDEKDVIIMSLFMQNPEISQAEIANKLNISQPSINFRVQRLKKKGVLSFDVGTDFNKSNLFLARVDFTASDANEILNRLSSCSFFVNGFIMAGKHNVSVFLVHEDLRKIEAIINDHLRSDNQISDINVNIVVSSMKDFLLKMNLDKELSQERCRNINSCKTCEEVGRFHNIDIRVK
ncbi:Lrp/AsnC family transcriptional regulator [Candidatus Woesearchaeota archaeon]|nr:Lrp/AsnC family transcriptional regulator [Candidatus Woesearchaeota archaeon]